MKTKLLLSILVFVCIAFISCEKQMDELAISSNEEKDANLKMTQDANNAYVLEIPYLSARSIPYESITVSFDEVVNESRCPVGVFCFWEGFVEVAITFTKDYQSHSFTLFDHSNFRTDTTIAGYTIALLKVYPERPKQGSTDYSNYVITVQITIEDQGCESIVEKKPDFNDPYKILDAKIDGDCINIYVEYSGGCAEHIFDLFRMQYAIAIYPPPPPTLVLFHEDNNDMCDAILRDTRSFDLTSLQKPWRKKIEFSLMSNDGSYYKKFIYEY